MFLNKRFLSSINTLCHLSVAFAFCPLVSYRPLLLSQQLLQHLLIVQGQQHLYSHHGAKL